MTHDAPQTTQRAARPMPHHRVRPGADPHPDGGQHAEHAPAHAAQLLTDPRLGGRGNGATRRQLLLQLQRTYGSRAVRGWVQRQPSAGAGRRPIVIQRKHTVPDVINLAKSTYPHTFANVNLTTWMGTNKTADDLIIFKRSKIPFIGHIKKRVQGNEQAKQELSERMDKVRAYLLLTYYNAAGNRQAVVNEKTALENLGVTDQDHKPGLQGALDQRGIRHSLPVRRAQENQAEQQRTNLMGEVQDFHAFTGNTNPGQYQHEKEAAARWRKQLLVDAARYFADKAPNLRDQVLDGQFLITLAQGLANQRDVTFSEVLDAISQQLALVAPPAPTLAPGGGGLTARIQDVINQNLPNAERVIQVGLLLRGSFSWVTEPDQQSMSKGTLDTFAHWVRSNTHYDPNYVGPVVAEPPARGTMNCWEGVFYAAYKAGLRSRQQLALLWQQADQGNYDQVIKAALNFPNAVVMDPQRHIYPQRGDIIFVEAAGSDMHHVMIALGQRRGQHEVLSLWSAGGTYGALDVTTLEAVGQSAEDPVIRFAPNPF